MIAITKDLANNILTLIQNQISSVSLITNQATRNVLITNKTIVDNSSANELSLNIEIYRSDEVSETLTEIRFFDSSNNLVLKTTNLNVSLPASRVSFIYQIKLVYTV
jgi:methionine-rich copper-binding protein CopC